jgi:hypothetical protein
MEQTGLKKPGHRWLSLAVSVLISLGLAGWLLHQIRFQDLMQVFYRLYLPSLALYMILALGGVAARTYRYRILVSSQDISYFNLGLVTLIRNLFVDLLPAKVGSLSYVYLLCRRFGFPLEVAASSFLIAFIFDFIVVFPLIFLALLTTRINPFPVSGVQFAGLSLAILVFLVLMVVFLERCLRIAADLLEWLPGRKRPKEETRLQFLIRKIRLTADDVRKIKEQKVYGRVFAASLAVRFFKYSSLYFLLFAVLEHRDFTLKTLSFWMVLLGFLGAEFSALLPIHGIAGLGTWEAAWTFTFSLMGFFDRELAILSGFSVHLTTQIFEYSLGILAILWLALPLSGKRIFSNK